MKRMSIGQTVLRAVLTLILFVGLLQFFSIYVIPNPDLSRQVQRLAAYLPEPVRMSLIGLILVLVAIALVFLLFLISGKIISLALRIAGRDPVAQYRTYNQLCREKMGNVETRLQLEQPVYFSTRIRKFCTRTILILLCLFVFLLVVFHIIGTMRRVLLSVLLGLLAALGVLLVYFLLWMIAKAISGKFVRIRRIKK